jgi:hypothetical protein
MNLSKNAMLFFLVFICLTVVIVSCKTILQHTIGKTIYKNRYLNAHSNLKEFYCKVPYQVIDGKIIIQVSFNSSEQKFWFLFDTGSRSFISEELTKRLGLVPMQTNILSTDINNAVVNTSLFQIPNLSVGGFDIFNLDVLVIQKDLSKICKVKIDGILGSNIIDLAVFQFQSDSGNLIITNSISKLDKKSLNSIFKIKQKWQGDLVSKDFYFGRKRRSVIFDSGYDGLLLMTTDSTKLFKNSIFIQDIIKERYYSLRAQHSEKIHKISYYEFKDVQFSGMNMRSVVVPVFDGGENYCLIGSALYTKGTVTIDSKENKIYLGAYLTPHLYQGDTRISNIKFGWSPERGAYISALTVNGKLEKQGLHVYDSVLTINNVAMDQFENLCSFEKFIESTGISTKEFTFTSRNTSTTKYIKITPELMYE